MDSTQEQQLIRKARANPQHFRELYRAYLPKVYAYVAYRLPQAADTEDVVSEVFLKAIKNLKQFKGASFAAWLFSIARNAVYDFYRRHGYAPIEDLEDETPDKTPPLDTSVIADENRDEMLRLIGTLSPRRQEVITLKFFGGLQNYEIATVLNLDERSVASHLCRALRDLHERYLTERKISHER
jgi:RNA polymerase sigma-70 factor (ECF subfamily)